MSYNSVTRIPATSCNRRHQATSLLTGAWNKWLAGDGRDADEGSGDVDAGGSNVMLTWMAMMLMMKPTHMHTNIEIMLAGCLFN